jgi:hypothetical protein
MTFAMWMEQLDNSCQEESDLVIHILPQHHFRSAYSRGISPEDFSRRALIRIRAVIRSHKAEVSV